MDFRVPSLWFWGFGWEGTGGMGREGAVEGWADENVPGGGSSFLTSGEESATSGGGGES